MAARIQSIPRVFSRIPSVLFRHDAAQRERSPKRASPSRAGHLAAACRVVVLGACLLSAASTRGADNALTPVEAKDGWVLLFDGMGTDGWMTSAGKPPASKVEQGALQPHKSGHYMLVHTQQWGDFVLKLDFKLSAGCNSGVFVRTASLESRPGKDVGYNGIEIALDDTKGAGFHDTGAVYDLVKPLRNAMKPAGEWNQMEIACIGRRIEVVLNGDPVTRCDLELFTAPNKRPDGSVHKFDTAWKDHPLRGFIGLQDHGSPCWFRNIKLKPIPPKP